jgi:signal transduction histidine kinase
MIQDIREYTRVLNDLIGSVLELSRIDSERVSTERQRLDLAQLARQEADKQQPLAQKKSQSLRVTGSEHLAVWGNTDQLQRVVRNLLNNAIKYTPDGGQITCECLAWADGATVDTTWPGSDGLPVGRWAALRVVDNGPGIGQEHLSNVFERFFRVESQGSILGTGLGLAIAQELVNLHEGHIAVYSVPGEGSTFAVYLPLLEE